MSVDVLPVHHLAGGGQKDRVLHQLAHHGIWSRTHSKSKARKKMTAEALCSLTDELVWGVLVVLVPLHVGEDDGVGLLGQGLELLDVEVVAMEGLLHTARSVLEKLSMH